MTLLPLLTGSTVYHALPISAIFGCWVVVYFLAIFQSVVAISLHALDIYFSLCDSSSMRLFFVLTSHQQTFTIISERQQTNNPTIIRCPSRP